MSLRDVARSPLKQTLVTSQQSPWVLTATSHLQVILKETDKNGRKELNWGMLLRKISIIWGDVISDWQSLERGWRLELFQFGLKYRMGLYFSPSITEVNSSSYTMPSPEHKSRVWLSTGAVTCLFSLYYMRQVCQHEVGLFGRFSEVKAGRKFEICGH